MRFWPGRSNQIFLLQSIASIGVLYDIRMRLDLSIKIITKRDTKTAGIHGERSIRFSIKETCGMTVLTNLSESWRPYLIYHATSIFFLKFVNKKSNQEDLNYEKSHKQYQLKRLTKYSVFDIIGENLFIYLSNEYRPSREHFPQIGLQNLTFYWAFLFVAVRVLSRVTPSSVFKVTSKGPWHSHLMPIAWKRTHYSARSAATRSQIPTSRMQS